MSKGPEAGQSLENLKEKEANAKSGWSFVR